MSDGGVSGMSWKKHKYTKSYGDGSPRGYCRCGLPKEHELHDDSYPETKLDHYNDGTAVPSKVNSRERGKEL